jgi:DnaJ-class molecular chaperone
MAQHRSSLSIADALRVFEGLTRGLPQSANELKDVYRAWMKAHHPDITGKRDPLSQESVQWMNAAYDVLKGQDWTKPSHTETTADEAPEWTDVGRSSRVYPDFDDELRQREEQLRRWRERQEQERREKEEQRQKGMEAFHRHHEELKKRPLWQKLLWGQGDRGGDDGLKNPGFLWCC